MKSFKYHHKKTNLSRAHLVWMLLMMSFVVGILTPQSAYAQERRIIDVQLHALSLDMFPAQYDKRIGYERPESPRALRSQSIEQMERFNIVKAVVSGEPELVKNYKKAAPNRVVKSIWIPDRLTGDSLRRYLDSLPRWYRQGKFEIIGEVLTQYKGIAPNDPILDPLWSFAAREGVPVGIHINDLPSTCPDSLMERCTPMALKEVLNAHPGLKVYVMHGGFPHSEDMLAILNNYPNVYVDATFFNPKSEKYLDYLKKLIDAGHGDRIMFGTDQMLWPELIGLFVQAIENADFLSEEQKQDIFYDNAARFFGIGKDKTLGAIE